LLSFSFFVCSCFCLFTTHTNKGPAYETAQDRKSFCLLFQSSNIIVFSSPWYIRLSVKAGPASAIASRGLWWLSSHSDSDKGTQAVKYFCAVTANEQRKEGARDETHTHTLTHTRTDTHTHSHTQRTVCSHG
jgi:hypothetical protein